jgi:YD repeat-containing protein
LVSAEYTWTFDANGRITGFTSPDGSTTYSYDANGQLTAVDNPGTQPDESYSYDANGNRTNSGYTTDADNPYGKNIHPPFMRPSFDDTNATNRRVAPCR